MYKEWNSVNPHHDEAALSVYASTGVSSAVSLGEGVFVEQLARPLLNENLKLTDVPAPWSVIQSFFISSKMTNVTGTCHKNVKSVL